MDDARGFLMLGLVGEQVEIQSVQRDRLAVAGASAHECAAPCSKTVAAIRPRSADSNHSICLGNSMKTVRTMKKRRTILTDLLEKGPWLFAIGNLTFSSRPFVVQQIGAARPHRPSANAHT